MYWESKKDIVNKDKVFKIVMDYCEESVESVIERYLSYDE